MTRERNKRLKDTARYMAMVVRNAMEDFHCEHLTDEQMEELNPIIRNAIYTALYAAEHVKNERWCREFVQFQLRAVPNYWEAPRFTDGVMKLRKLYRDKDANHP